jgi:uncharacterized OsmC-like protein
MINSINVCGLSEFVHDVREDHEEAVVGYGVTLDWLSGTRTRVRPRDMTVGHHRVTRDFSFEMDEPTQLVGLNAAPTPQEMLLGGLAGCMAVTFVAGASALGITLEKLSLEIDGRLDLRGFLGLDSEQVTGFESLSYRFIVKGDGTETQYRKIAERVMIHSPNYATITSEVEMMPDLVIVDEAA